MIRLVIMCIGLAFGFLIGFTVGFVVNKRESRERKQQEVIKQELTCKDIHEMGKAFYDGLINGLNGGNKIEPKELIQKYTNNGSMIADIFNITDTKNVKTSINEELNLVEVCGDEFTMWFDIDWWDAPYEKDYIPKDILDKIRAEIIDLRSRQNVGVLECLDIIDKYKAKSEK